MGDIFTPKSCQRCGAHVLKAHRINGLCLKCWDDKPKLDMPIGVHTYRNVAGQLSTVTVKARK